MGAHGGAETSGSGARTRVLWHSGGWSASGGTATTVGVPSGSGLACTHTPVRDRGVIIVPLSPIVCDREVMGNVVDYVHTVVCVCVAPSREAARWCAARCRASR